MPRYLVPELLSALRDTVILWVLVVIAPVPWALLILIGVPPVLLAIPAVVVLCAWGRRRFPCPGWFQTRASCGHGR